MKRQDEKQMRHLYLQWLESGQSKTAFAKIHQIVPTTFYYWIKKFQDQLAFPAATSTGFSLVSGGEPPLLANSQPTVRICYPSGVWVELYGKLDAALLKILAG